MLVLLGILVFIYHFEAGIYLALGEEPLPSFEFLYHYSFLCGVVWWLQGDGRRSGIIGVYCLGLIVGIGWIVIIPYHLLKTRGAKGLIPLAALVGAIVAAHVFALIVTSVF